MLSRQSINGRIFVGTKDRRVASISRHASLVFTEVREVQYPAWPLLGPSAGIRKDHVLVERTVLLILTLMLLAEFLRAHVRPSHSLAPCLLRAAYGLW